jgi:hypothetical protein
VAQTKSLNQRSAHDLRPAQNNPSLCGLLISRSDDHNSQ